MTLPQIWRSAALPFRLLGIARVLARHDALAAVEDLQVFPTLVAFLRRLGPHGVPGRPGEKLARALVALGPSFIKLGQFLATRADLIGEAMAADLAQLHDRLPPFPTEAARRAIERELGRPLDAVFLAFDPKPVSAASIAQVHFALTRPAGDEDLADGQAEPRAVAVKVLRPGIERAFERDLNLFYWLARLAERAQPRLRRLKPVELVDLFAETVRCEMDLRLEAAAASELASNFAGDDSYVVPEVDWERTGRRVLTMSRVSGIPLDDRAALLAAGQDIPRILEVAATIFFNQVFRDGFFHGDQHPGNMMVTESGAIAAVDFGIMGRLDRTTRYFLADMLLATLARDYRRLAQVHVDAGFLPPGQSEELFAQALRSVCEPIFGRPLQRISFARLLGQLLSLTESFSMPVQPQLVLLQKNMLMAEGVSRQLDPSLNIWLLAEPLIAEWVRVNRGPEARVREGAETLVQGLQRLPDLLRQLETAARQVADEGIKLHPEVLAALDRRRSTARLALAACALAGAALALAAVALVR
ncbi:2-octaprenylphenol hydroxylase [Tistlia consotensis]|uniref:2-octaprenylphenol hydroxylase n=1 Tax=Tistlia consotensis USBA 355 TaxID=560819 RepID=A0A1Y6B609_9PROT|nr:2-polyprenylphenol 6-hydroxylase [Tistlia consotensis]SME94006.1 2-octaprenylphenol hydroxylase [Tistlia consotensis USBA 355]SNR28975.1 2-octaprenylphenol hydroxylase [Tistlia consotensis]